MDLPELAGLVRDADEEPNPTPDPESISALCSSLGVSYTNLLVPCNFCRTTLTSVECVLFDYAECKLLWKNGIAYAICSYCLRLLAKFEFLVFHRHTTDAAKAEQMLNKPLTEFKLRCVTCLRRFQREEVQQLRDGNCTIFVLGYKLRAQCFMCAMGFF